MWLSESVQTRCPRFRTPSSDNLDGWIQLRIYIRILLISGSIVAEFHANWSFISRDIHCPRFRTLSSDTNTGHSMRASIAFNMFSHLTKFLTISTSRLRDIQYSFRVQYVVQKTVRTLPRTRIFTSDICHTVRGIFAHTYILEWRKSDKKCCHHSQKTFWVQLYPPPW